MISHLFRGYTMADDPGRKNVKVGVKEGGGPPPGYQWSVEILDQAYEEAMGFLNPDQYDHIVELQKKQENKNPGAMPGMHDHVEK